MSSLELVAMGWSKLNIYFKKKTNRKWFTNKVVNEWNRLSSQVISANKIQSFETGVPNLHVGITEGESRSLWRTWYISSNITKTETDDGRGVACVLGFWERCCEYKNVVNHCFKRRFDRFMDEMVLGKQKLTRVGQLAFYRFMFLSPTYRHSFMVSTSSLI